MKNFSYLEPIRKLARPGSHAAEAPGVGAASAGFLDRFLTLALFLLLMASLTACGDSANAATVEAVPTGDLVVGKQLFMSTCTACHGPDGKGLPGLGKNLVASEFAAEKNDNELVEFIKVGRGPDDPLNTTGVTMPAKGGKPSLSDEDLYNIVAYIRTIRE